MKKLVFTVCVSVCSAAFAQGRDSFVQQQAYAEMQRVSGQIDVLQNNLNDLQERLGRLERRDTTQGLRQEVDALKATVADLRRQMQSQRDEIVRDISGRIAKLQPPAPVTPPKPVVKEKVVMGPHIEYIVESGDTLSIISQAYNVPVKKIRELNNLKSDMLRVGQKLNLPK